MLNELYAQEESFLVQFDRMGVPRGGITLAEINELVYFVTNTFEDNQSVRIADVGCWTGMSSVFFAYALSKLTTTDKKLVSIDWFKGSPISNLETAGKYFNIKQICTDNIAHFDFTKNIVEIFEGMSDIAPQHFPNESFDAVFIDADHRYDYIKKDIAVWLPKVKKGGYLMGHDCEVIFDKEPCWPCDKDEVRGIYGREDRNNRRQRNLPRRRHNKT